MSVKNFIPTVWSATIDQALKEHLVAADFCNTQYEGEIAGAGDTVRILQAIRPTIIHTEDGKPIDMTSPEDPDDTALTMPINTQAGFNYSISNIDDAQEKGNLKSSLKDETTQGLANDVDKYIFGKVKNSAVKKSDSTSLTTDSILNFINKGFEYLWKQNVPANTDLELVISPAFHTVFLEAYSKLDTNNSDMLKNGIVGRYSNATVRMSNNLYNDGTDDYCILRTNKAIAYAKPLTTTEALKNPARLGDILRGGILYDAKVVRTKEIYVLKAHI